MKRRSQYALTLSLLGVATSFSLAPPPALAQSATGTLKGSVVDSAGKAIGGARVTISSSTTTVTLRTAADGTFSSPVAPDTYTVTVAIAGFQTSREDGISVTSGGNAVVKVSLANASLTTIAQTTVVRATSLNTGTAATANVSAQSFVDQGQSQVINVLDQQPGVEINRFSSNAPGANSSISTPPSSSELMKVLLKP